MACVYICKYYEDTQTHVHTHTHTHTHTHIESSSKGYTQRIKCEITDSAKPQILIQGHSRDASVSLLSTNSTPLRM